MNLEPNREPGTRHPEPSLQPLIIGIDLGTTNSALAWAEARGAISIFQIPQLVAAGEVAGRPTLPSFLYFTDQSERDAGTVRLPWAASPDLIAGTCARDEGSLVPSRQIASTKSWLSNPRVDRTAALLPWGAEGGPRLSPVEASARLLAHVRDGWNHEHARRGEEWRLDAHQVVLTVPASFDEEARELTVAAAHQAGIEQLTLLEEPLAALYAWIASHRRQLSGTFGAGALILVCDVGGGTTDFSLIRAQIEDGELAFARIAIGEHLLLGGDNLDLALASLVEQKLAQSGKLTVSQRQILRRKCTFAKEALLGGSGADRVPITLLGSGRGVVGGGMSTELTRQEVAATLTEGFLPITAPADVPARDRRVGLRELGLPYETEPAITRHLAGFLTRAGAAHGTGMMRPDAVLFNGGFFTPALARHQVLDALAAWFGAHPLVLENDAPESAVAIGAAFYGKLRRDPAAAKRLLIRAGSARSYYIGVDTADPTPPEPASPTREAPEPAAPTREAPEPASPTREAPEPASPKREAPEPASPKREARRRVLCLIPRGTEEGTRFELDRPLTVISNQPAAFTLYSSADRTDTVNALIAPGDSGLRDFQKHAPLVTAFRYGKRSRRVPLGIRLSAAFTETGTLEIWCRSEETDHRWRLAFNLRGVEADPLEGVAEEASNGETGVVVDRDSIAAAATLVRDVFAGTSPLAPEALIGELETLIGHGKLAWPLPVIRGLADVLLETVSGRRKGPAHEVRWLNLTGFCVRPGFGSTLDEWRISELRKAYAAGIAFPKEIQNQVEWLVLWQRVGAGFNAGQQRELALRVSGQLGLGQRKAARLNPQIERESWRLLASLERLDAGQRTGYGDALLERIRREPRNSHWLWALSRLGARQPLYGPLNAVVPASVAERWIERLLTLKEVTADGAECIAHIGARTADPARDIGDTAASSIAERLAAAGFENAAERLRVVAESTLLETGRLFGETLPEGLKVG
jgi:molecular chaperone DnaK (HSP70)